MEKDSEKESFGPPTGKTSASRWGRCERALSCPPSGVLSQCIYFIAANALIWGCAYFLDPYLALDTISSLVLLELLGLSVGALFRLIGLPDLLAPLVIGIILNNIPHLHFFHGLHSRKWIGPIRNIALTIILTQAGVQLSPKQLKKLGAVVPCAAFGPFIVEAFTCAIFLYAFFHDTKQIQPAMCFVAGFAIAAVSPAVIVPEVLILKKENYGVKSGIPTLLIAASSIDDVLAIPCFAIALSFVKTGEPVDELILPKLPMLCYWFAVTDNWKNYVGIVGVLVGTAQGFLFGIFMHFIPSKDMGHKRVPYLRVFILLLLNLFTIFLYDHDETNWLSGAGSVGVLVASFIASYGWRSEPQWKQSMDKVDNVLENIWTLFVPLLFGTIGNEILVADFNFNDIAILCIILCICLTIRCFTMFAITLLVKTASHKERIFCALSWIPKATVQATLAPLVVTEMENATGQVKDNAKTVVLLSVLGILLTAPLGAILISLTGKKLLRRASGPEDGSGDGDDKEGNPEEVIKIIPMDLRLDESLYSGIKLIKRNSV